MAKKREEPPEKDNAERWLLTYSDMITLLLALFVMLYAMSSVDAAKYEAVKEAMQEAFSGMGSIPKVLPSESDLPEMDEAPSPDELLEFSDLYYALLTEISARGYSDIVAVSQEGSDIVVRFKDTVLFYPDSAEMNPAGFEALDNISAIISRMSAAIGNIQIEGHTAFVSDEAYRIPVAWSLSANRAVAVLLHLYEAGYIEQSQMNVAGFSHFDPIASNDTEEGRAQNRRVELRISPPEGWEDKLDYPFP